MTTAESLFEPDDRGWVATELSRGPWDPRHCHGGPVGALLARAVEQASHDHTDEPVWQITRLTIELTRPVPVLTPLTLATRIERPGRKVSVVSAVLAHDDVEVAHVRAQRIRHAEVPLPADTVHPVEPPMPPPSHGHLERVTWAAPEGQIAFHRHACEHRFVEGSWLAPGPVAVWIRLVMAVVPGEEPSGVQRAAAAADFGNGVSGALPYERYVYINPDLTLHLSRPPRGEWIGMRTASHYAPHGAGFAESALYDIGEGSDIAPGGAERVGRSVQSLLVESR